MATIRLREGVVSAATPEASETGRKVLEDGGNAVDAAVAVSLALGVTEPAGSGIGGQATFIVHPWHGEAFVINGTSHSPETTRSGASLSDLTKHRASTVPAILKTLDHAWRMHGSGRQTWADLVEPAVRFADEGYEVGPFRHKALLRHLKAIKSSATASLFLLNPDGSVPSPGTRVRNRKLSRTLRRIAKDGVDDFYEGWIADEIHRDMEENGGWVTRDDLRRVPCPMVQPPLRGKYRDWVVKTLPPPASGWVVLLALNLLEQAPEGMLSVEGPARTAWMAETLKTAHRHRIYSPVFDLEDYSDAVARKTSKAKAAQIARAQFTTGSGETTHFSIVDGDGMVVGVTQSLNSYFGAKVGCPSLGFLYNDYMREFVAGATRHPFALRPGGMPYSSMSATILSRKAEPHIAVGSPGDERIISAVIQIVSHWVDLAQGIEAAVAAPRMHTIRGEELLLEKRPDDVETLLKLERRGFTVHQPLSSLFSGELNPYFGGVHAVAREYGRWFGASDPRRDGTVARSRGLQEG